MRVNEKVTHLKQTGTAGHTGNSQTLGKGKCSLFILTRLHKCMTDNFSYIYFVTFIEQKGECIIRYFGRPCDEFAER